MTEFSERTELLTPGPAEALAGLLDVRPPKYGEGEALPLLWHWLYLLDRPAQAVLGSDGHPASGSAPAPPAPGRRRMFAGGRVEAFGPLRFGQPATRRSFVQSSIDKEGRSGTLTFVTLAHEFTQNGTIVISEEQDIVYRLAQPDAGAIQTDSYLGTALPRRHDEWQIRVDPVLLFRFSALTYNSHRIHYDRDYARDVEGYPGLVVHGPLQAIAMTEAARRSGLLQDVSGQRVSFAYRLVAPLFERQGLVASATALEQTVTTGIRDEQGRVTATGTILLDC